MNALIKRLVARTSVVHSVPGRLRLHVPVIARIPEAAAADVLAGRVVAAVAGITSMSVSRVTSTIVVNYDRSSWTEEAVITLVRDIIETLTRNVDRYTALNEASRRTVVDRVIDHFTESGIRPGKRIQIPDAIWNE